MAIEPQLIEYIKKAREVGQTDQETRNLLFKNGWSVSEVDEAFAYVDKLQSQQTQSGEQNQPQTPIQAQTEARPQPDAESQFASQVEAKPQVQVAERGQQVVSSKRTSFFKILLKILLVLVIVVVIVGAVFAIAKYFNFSWDSLYSLLKGAPKVEPKTVVANMLANLENIKSFQGTIKIEAEVSENKNKESLGKLIFEINEKKDITNPTLPKSATNINIGIQARNLDSPSASLDLDMVVIGNTSYLKINEIELPPSVEEGLDFSKIKNIWFKADQDSINALNQVGPALILSVFSGQKQLDVGEQLDAGEMAQQVQELQTMVQEMVLSGYIIPLNDEVINGQKVYHYSILITKDQLAQLADKIINTTSKLQKIPQNNLLEDEIKSLMAGLINTIGDMPIELWIGKTDYMLYKTKLDKTININTLLGMGATIDLKITSTNSNINKTISIVAPTGEINKIETVLLPVFQIFGIRSDMTRIGSLANSLFLTKKNYSSLCYSGLLNGYLKDFGEELIGLNNDIIKRGGKKPVCFSSATDFCVSTQLSDGTYLCIGKNNTIGKVRCVSAQTVCK